MNYIKSSTNFYLDTISHHLVLGLLDQDQKGTGRQLERILCVGDWLQPEHITKSEQDLPRKSHKFLSETASLEA